jgi:hypothetical protein
MYQLIALLALLLTTGCGGGPRYADYFPQYDDGTPKPKVAFVPMINHTAVQSDLNQKLTEKIRYRTKDNGDLFLFSEGEVAAMRTNAGPIDILGTDLSYSKSFAGADFVVLTELVEHAIQPADAGANATQNLLSVKVRVKVVDVRRTQPRVIMQEIFQTSHRVVDPNIDNNRYTYDRVTNDIVTRLENVIWSAK